MMFTSEVIYVSFFVLSIIGIQGKPSLSLNFPSLALFSGSTNGREQRQAAKLYSGKRLKNDSVLMAYFHDQTVAVVELGPKKLLLNCELIEVYDPDEALKVLGGLEDLAQPLHISLHEMLTLMSQCQQLEQMMPTYSTISSNTYQPSRSQITSRGLFSNSPLSLFSGIIPGTKWCGTGDIALDYYDLGAEPNVDRCCRAHDLCPVKIRAYSHRYNLTNNSLYTKSHCDCDDHLYDCLRGSNSPTAHIMGNIYFNLIQVPCIEETANTSKFRKAKNNF